MSDVELDEESEDEIISVETEDTSVDGSVEGWVVSSVEICRVVSVVNCKSSVEEYADDELLSIVVEE